MLRFDVTTEVEPASLRGRLGRLLQKIFPDLDRRAYARARRADIRSRARDGLNESSKNRYPVVCSRRKIYDSAGETHVVVVPAEGRETGSWRVAAGNFYFEAFGNLQSQIGNNRVSVLHVSPDTPASKWHQELFDHLMDVKATHLVSHIEHDPGSTTQAWTWDSFWWDFASRWRGVLVGGTFDASYRFISAKARVLAQMSPRFMAVDAGLSIAGTFKRNRFEVGPVNRPMSPATLEVINGQLRNIQPSYDVVFVGSLYPYRVELLKSLEESGLSVVVNPHRNVPVESSIDVVRGQPSWLDYVTGLRLGRLTINFSRSSAGPIEQLKWRAVETGLAGAYFVTDDQYSTRQFWSEDQFSTFESPEDLPVVLEKVLSDPQKLKASAAGFAERAELLARHHYWGAIERGLIVRGLPRLGVTPFAE